MEQKLGDGKFEMAQLMFFSLKTNNPFIDQKMRNEMSEHFSIAEELEQKAFNGDEKAKMEYIDFINMLSKKIFDFILNPKNNSELANQPQR